MKGKVKNRAEQKADDAISVIDEELEVRRKQLETLTNEVSSLEEKLAKTKDMRLAIDGAVQQLELIRNKLGGNAAQEEPAVVTEA